MGPSAGPSTGPSTGPAAVASSGLSVANADVSSTRWLPWLPWVPWLLALLFALAVGAATLAWSTQQRLKAIESQLVKRQQDSAVEAGEARTLARSADTLARESAAKVTLLDARVAETVMHRSQFEDLIQSLSRSRDENVLADVESAIRVATQQTAITGSAEPLVQVLRQADERLARHNQPRLERVRRAVAQDLERTRAAGVVDLSVLTIRLDDVMRQVDELPLLAEPGSRASRAARAQEAGAQGGEAQAAGAAVAASASGAAASAVPSAAGWLGQVGETFWREARSLLRVTRIERAEAMLLAPEQAYFLRENLKLRLLNARVALLSRQFDTAQADLREAQAALDRYFDRSAKRTQSASASVRQVLAQARTIVVPRPDATLAAIAAAAAGR
jgi:uroporphyrin-III C-methyltransferase